MMGTPLLCDAASMGCRCERCHGLSADGLDEVTTSTPAREEEIPASSPGATPEVAITSWIFAFTWSAYWLALLLSARNALVLSGLKPGKTSRTRSLNHHLVSVRGMSYKATTKQDLLGLEDSREVIA